MKNQHLRAVVIACGFVVSLLTGLRIIQASLDAAGIEGKPIRQTVATTFRDAVAATPSASGAYRIAMLGDSMLVSYPQGAQVPDHLQSELRRRTQGDAELRVVNLGMSGTGAFDYYFLADIVAAAEPQLVVISFNLTSTSDAFRSAFSRPEMAGWVGTDRIFETLLLPGSWIGLTADRLLFYTALVRLDLVERWMNFTTEQTRIGVAHREIEHFVALARDGQPSPEDALRKRQGMRAMSARGLSKTRRYNAEGIRYQYHSALDGFREDNPTLRLLGAAMRTYREMGIEVLVYLTPFNREHVENIGVFDREKFERSLRILEAAVTDNGGVFVDLHAIFPDAHFRDKPGHLVYQGEVNGPALLAEALAPRVLEIVRSSGGRGD